MARLGGFQPTGIRDGLITSAGSAASAPDRTSHPCRQEKYGQIMLPQLTGIADGRVSEELCASAATMANNLNARAIFVYTRRGYMANFLSRCRPDCPIFAFTGGHRCMQNTVLLQLCVLTQVATLCPYPPSQKARPSLAVFSAEVLTAHRSAFLQPGARLTSFAVKAGSSIVAVADAIQQLEEGQLPSSVSKEAWKQSQTCYCGHLQLL